MAFIQRHELKTWPEPFEAILAGRKTFEYRINDRNFQEGDELILLEWNPPGMKYKKPKQYTGRRIRAIVSYITKDEFGVPNGFVVMGLKDPFEI